MDRPVTLVTPSHFSTGVYTLVQKHFSLEAEVGIEGHFTHPTVTHSGYEANDRPDFIGWQAALATARSLLVYRSLTVRYPPRR